MACSCPPARVLHAAGDGALHHPEGRPCAWVVDTWAYDDAGPGCSVCGHRAVIRYRCDGCRTDFCRACFEATTIVVVCNCAEPGLVVSAGSHSDRVSA